MRVKSPLPERQDKPRTLAEIRDALDRVFGDWFRETEPKPGVFETKGGDYLPRVDVSETDHEILVSAELPGVEEQDVEVELTTEYLTIRGEKREETVESRKGYFRSERGYGAFRRDVTLPCEVEADQVNARFHNGVLSVTLPKTPQARRDIRKIPVRAE